MTADERAPEPAPPTGPEPAPEPAAQVATGGVMPLFDHLAELRRRLVWSIVAIGVGAAIGFIAGQPIIEFLSQPLKTMTNAPLFFTSMGDPFAIRVQVALVAGVILAMPVLLWHIWRFVSPGLTPRERRAIRPWIPAALFFFLLGVSIAYIILPFAVQFLLSFETPDLQPLLTVREYFGFVTTLFLAFGILMEFPILLVGLSRVRIVTSERLRRARRLVILGIAVFSAVATPGGDLVSPTVLGIALYVLFELTVVVIRRSGR